VVDNGEVRGAGEQLRQRALKASARHRKKGSIFWRQFSKNPEGKEKTVRKIQVVRLKCRGAKSEGKRVGRRLHGRVQGE